MTSRFVRGLAFLSVLMAIIGAVQNSTLTTTLPRALTSPSVNFALENINPLYYFIRTFYIYPDIRPSSPYSSLTASWLTDLACFKHCRADSRCRLSARINGICNFYDENLKIERQRGINSLGLRTLDLSRGNCVRGYLLSSPFKSIEFNFTDQICYQICLLIPNCTAVTNLNNSCNLFDRNFSYGRSGENGFYAVGPITFEPKIYPFVRLFLSYNDDSAISTNDANLCFQRCAAERQCIASMIYGSKCLFYDVNMVVRKEHDLRAFVFKSFNFETAYSNIRFTG